MTGGFYLRPLQLGSSRLRASDKALEHFLGMRAAIDQFHQLSQEEMRARAKERPSDLLQVLGAHADFKWQILGEEGAAHLDSLVNLAREWDDSVKRAVHRRTLRDSIEWQFCDRFLKEAASRDIIIGGERLATSDISFQRKVSRRHGGRPMPRY